jgi:retinol dehydrogenase 12
MASTSEILYQTASYAHSHLLVSLPIPVNSFAGQVVIITGGNTGLGLEAARHICRLGAAKVIVTSRSFERAQEAADDIAKTTGRIGVVEGWTLDLAEYTSVKAFAARAESELPRLDVLVNNAVSWDKTFALAEGNELTVTVDVLSPLLLSMLLLPKMRETSMTFKVHAVITVVSSFMHALASFSNLEGGGILEALADATKAQMNHRYLPNNCRCQ